MENEVDCPGCGRVIDTSHNLKKCPMCEHSLIHLYKEPVTVKWYKWGPYPFLLAFTCSIVLAAVVGTIASAFISQPNSVCVFPITILSIVVMYQSFRFIYSRLKAEQEEAPLPEKDHH